MRTRSRHPTFLSCRQGAEIRRNISCPVVRIVAGWLALGGTKWNLRFQKLLVHVRRQRPRRGKAIDTRVPGLFVDLVGQLPPVKNFVVLQPAIGFHTLRGISSGPPTPSQQTLTVGIGSGPNLHRSCSFTFTKVASKPGCFSIGRVLLGTVSVTVSLKIGVSTTGPISAYW